MKLTLLTLALGYISYVYSRGLVDDPIISASRQYLDGEGWIATSEDGKTIINGNVPGDLITDMQLAGLIGDPLYGM